MRRTLADDHRVTPRSPTSAPPVQPPTRCTAWPGSRADVHPPGNTQSTSLSRDRGDRPHRRVARTQRDERRPLRPDPSPPPSLLGSPSCGALADHPPVYPFAGQLLIHELTHACQLDHNNLPVGGGGCSGMSTRPTTSPGTHIHHDGSPYKAVGGIHRTNNRSRSSTSGSVAAGSTPATGPKTGTARTTRMFTTVPGPVPTSPHRSTCPANPAVCRTTSTSTCSVGAGSSRQPHLLGCRRRQNCGDRQSFPITHSAEPGARHPGETGQQLTAT